MKRIRRILKLGAIFTLVAIFSLSDAAPGILRLAGLPNSGQDLGIKEAQAATAFYLRDSTSPINPGSDEERDLLLTRGSASIDYAIDTVNGPVTPPTAGTQFTKTPGGATQIWYTNPLNAVMVAGTVTFNLRAKEFNNPTNATITAELLRANNAGTILSTIATVLLDRPETSTSDSQENWTRTPTSTALSAGDRLAVRVYMDDGNGVTMSAGSNRVVTMSIDGPTAGAVGDSYVQLTEAVTEQVIATTTIANGTDPGSSTVAPESGITDLDSFVLSTTTGTDSVTALTATLTGANSFESLSEVRITNNAGTTTYFSAVTNPASNTVNFSGGTPIPVTTTPTQFKIRITPKTHANMPPPAGTSYSVGGTVTAYTVTKSKTGTDSGSATITVDNASPTVATALSGSAGDAQVTLNWTTSASSDFSRSVMLRWTGGSAGAEVPAEGTDYSNGDTITTAIVVCVRTADAASTAVSGTDGADTGGCSATALTNGQAYTYKVFQKDSRGNYNVGAFIGTFTPVAGAGDLVVGTANTQIPSLLIPSSDNNLRASFTFIRSAGSATVTRIVLTETNSVNANAQLSNVRLYYKVETTCSTVLPSGAIAFNGTGVSFNASEQAVVDGTMPVDSSQTCLYVLLDVGSGAADGQIIDLEISDPSANVTVSAGVSSPATVVAMSGTTLLTTTAGSSSSTLTLQMANPAKNPTVFTLSNGIVWMQEGADSAIALNSGKVTVSSLTFTNLSYPGTSGIVRVRLIMNYNSSSGRQEYIYEKIFNGSAVPRQ